MYYIICLYIILLFQYINNFINKFPICIPIRTKIKFIYKTKHVPKAVPTFSSGGRDGNIRSVMFIIVCRQLSLIVNYYLQYNLCNTSKKNHIKHIIIK